jgi:hypothetical protein
LATTAHDNALVLAAFVEVLRELYGELYGLNSFDDLVKMYAAENAAKSGKDPAALAQKLAHADDALLKKVEVKADAGHEGAQLQRFVLLQLAEWRGYAPLNKSVVIVIAYMDNKYRVSASSSGKGCEVVRAAAAQAFGPESALARAGYNKVEHCPLHAPQVSAYMERLGAARHTAGLQAHRADPLTLVEFTMVCKEMIEVADRILAGEVEGTAGEVAGGGDVEGGGGGGGGGGSGSGGGRRARPPSKPLLARKAVLQWAHCVLSMEFWQRAETIGQIELANVKARVFPALEYCFGRLGFELDLSGKFKVERIEKKEMASAEESRAVYPVYPDPSNALTCASVAIAVTILLTSHEHLVATQLRGTYGPGYYGGPFAPEDGFSASERRAMEELVNAPPQLDGQDLLHYRVPLSRLADPLVQNLPTTAAARVIEYVRRKAAAVARAR